MKIIFTIAITATALFFISSLINCNLNEIQTQISLIIALIALMFTLYEHSKNREVSKKLNQPNPYIFASLDDRDCKFINIYFLNEGPGNLILADTSFCYKDKIIQINDVTRAITDEIEDSNALKIFYSEINGKRIIHANGKIPLIKINFQLNCKTNYVKVISILDECKFYIHYKDIFDKSYKISRPLIDSKLSST